MGKFDLVKRIFQRGKFPQFLYYLSEPDPEVAKKITDKLNKQDPQDFDVLVFNGDVRVFYFSDGHYHEVGSHK